MAIHGLTAWADSGLDDIFARARAEARVRWTGRLWAVDGCRYRTKALALASVWGP